MKRNPRRRARPLRCPGPCTTATCDATAQDRFADVLGASRGRPVDDDARLLARADRLVADTVITLSGETMLALLPELHGEPDFVGVLHTKLIYHDRRQATRVHVGVLNADGNPRFCVLVMHRPSGRGFDEPEYVTCPHTGPCLDDALDAANDAVHAIGPAEALVGRGEDGDLTAERFREECDRRHNASVPD